ncbi:MAG: hypothetical protein PHS49_06010 [Candidatus Gracilibacteria bacterium]|nr:hypothetical protein [Candidatus Gracilibacteria bacterium]
MRVLENSDTYDIEYNVEKEIENKSGVIYHRFFFKDTSGNLLSYISFNLDKDVVYIIDITNSNGYKFMTEGMKKIYQENGYTEGIGYKSFGVEATSYVLNYIYENYNEVGLLLVNSYKKNENKVWDLIDKVSIEIGDIIKKITGGNEQFMSTIFLNRNR